MCVLEAPAAACHSLGSWLPREVLAPGPLAGACSYFRKPPGKGKAGNHVALTFSSYTLGKTRGAQPGFTCPSLCSSPAQKLKFGALKPLAA